jgi:hypothetical protein
MASMARRKYQELFSGTGRFTANTRTCLERAVGRALYGHKGSTMPLRSAVYTATRELRAEGLDAAATLAVLGAVVENAGRACGADRSSLMSGHPVWVPLQQRVLALVRLELAGGRGGHEGFVA